jgi:hypothetical protein
MAMESTNSFRITPRLIVGLAILTLGILWTLESFDIVDVGRIWEWWLWWPAVLILIGLARLFDRTSGKAGSIFLIVIGGLFLASNLGLMEWDFWDFIPVIIALLGAKLIIDAVGRRSARPLSENDPNSLMSVFAMMAGVRRQSTSRDFRGGEATAIMGGVELDLREAAIKDGQEAVIDTFSMMGGIELTIPENWTVVGKVLPLMGGFEDKTKPPREAGPRLVIKGMAIMGGVEVKN